MKRKNKGYWNKNNCKKEALKYKKRSEFKMKAGGAYNFAKNNGFLNEICFHMQIIGNRFKRLVYSYVFPDNSVYVGLTGNIEERDNKHKRDPDSSVFRHISKTNLEPQLSIHSEYIFAYDASKLEGKIVQEYKDKGYYILNQAPTGVLGGENIKWTFEKCKEEALKFTYKGEFGKKSNSAYNAARRYKWLNKICSHMITLKDSFPKNYWTKNRCEKEALKYKTRNEFYKNSSGAYMACIKNKWLDQVCSHMNGKGKKPNGYWNKQRCIEAIENFSSLKEFRKKNYSAYKSAFKNKWLDDISVHMIKI
jgi:predicted GIY-YIG superfamily endonuclease